jgi:2C-methyl-D-erythritol 2,4-cyclodiphosphate synthase
LLTLIIIILALEEEIPITDPRFYSSETLCPDSLIEYIFRGAKQSNKLIPLLRERIAIIREVGYILCNVSRHLTFHTPKKLTTLHRAMEALSKAS